MKRMSFALAILLFMLLVVWNTSNDYDCDLTVSTAEMVTSGIDVDVGGIFAINYNPMTTPDPGIYFYPDLHVWCRSGFHNEAGQYVLSPNYPNPFNVTTGYHNYNSKRPTYTKSADATGYNRVEPMTLEHVQANYRFACLSLT